jgi:DNA-binding beta-propeller fold protein YncE
MKISTRLAGVGALAAAATGIVAGPAQASTAHHPAGAVFVQTDNLGGNAVVAYDRLVDGALRPAGTYPTGGVGGQLDQSVVDHTASEGSMAYDRAHGLLYVTNAGSNTLTVFGVNGDRLHRLQVVASGGNFPVSVTFHGNLVYVLNARDGGAVQGFVRLGTHLVKVASWHRGLGLDESGTPEFTHTPGQVAFTPDGSRLVVTTKAAADSIDVFPLDRWGAPAAHPVRNVETGAVPFAVAFDRFENLAVVEAGPSAIATFRIRRDNTVALVQQAVTGQAGTCWVTYTNGRFYTSNAGSGSVSGYATSASGRVSALGDTATDAGTVDATASSDGRYLYVEAGRAGTVDSFRIGRNGALTKTGSVTVPGAAGAEGIVAS